MTKRPTSKKMKILYRTDRNTRALAKVVSAAEYLLDSEYPPLDLAAQFAAVRILNDAKFAIVQERRNLRIALWNELDKQAANVRT